MGQIYVYDVDGRKVLLPTPQEQRTRKVLEDGPGGKVSEETIERRDVNGNKLPPEKVRIVERQGSGGEKIIETTTYQTDLNGRLAPAERSLVTTQQQGNQVSSTTIVERPSVNGGMAPVERIASQTVKQGEQESTTRATYVLDSSGNFVEAVRESIEKVKKGNETREVVNEFRNAQTGKLEMTGQRVVVEMTNADGTKSSEISIYGAVAPGRAADGKLKLREQQLVTTKPGQGNTQVESISVRRPDLSDSKMGAYQKVGERIVPKATNPSNP